jgi:hypothetical protein
VPEDLILEEEEEEEEELKFVCGRTVSSLAIGVCILVISL